MPIYDMYCKNCGTELIDVYAKINSIIKCPKCNAILKRVTNCHSFKLLYDPKKDSVGWGFNNYERSQYWDHVKENNPKKQF